MTTATFSSTSVDLTDDGFFARPEQWAEAMVPDLAAREGIDPMTEAHWHVVRVMRAEYVAKGAGPALRALSRTSGVPMKRLFELFPKGPAKVAARIAGIPKPRGCI